MADDDPDIEVITSPRKVANIRCLSSIRANFRRYSDILSHTTRKKSKSEPSAKKATKRRAQATPTGRVTLRRLPGQQQALLAFGKHSQASTSKLPATSAGASGSATKLALTSVGPSTSAGKREGLPHSYSDSSGSEDIPLPVPRKPSDATLPGVRIPHFVGKQKAASLGLGDSDNDTVPTGAQKAVTQDRLQSKTGTQGRSALQRPVKTNKPLPLASGKTGTQSRSTLQPPVKTNKHVASSSVAAGKRKAISDEEDIEADEDSDVLKRIDAKRLIIQCQGKLSTQLRAQRPLRTGYRLGAAVMYISAAGVQEGEVTGWYKPRNEAYVHPEVVSLLDDNNLSHLRDKFEIIGAFTHADIVQLSLDIQGAAGWIWKSDLMTALELQPQAVDWHRLMNVLLAYVRPL